VGPECGGIKDMVGVLGGFPLHRRRKAASLSAAISAETGRRAARGAMGRKGSDGRDGKYAGELRQLQIELVKFERHLIATGGRVVVVIEGRDAAGKDGAIKSITEHLSPRETRVVALGKPSDREFSQWYFQRYVRHLPAAGEFVLFNRSWYNRAGVERVMKFCTEAEAEEFLAMVPTFEWMLANSGIRLLKYYLEITRKEQAHRLAQRRRDPLKQWKTSPVDTAALKKWAAYSGARNEMLMKTHSAHAPWFVVDANHKHPARLNLIRHMLSQLHYKRKDMKLLKCDPDVVFEFDQARLYDGSIAE
jgi:polyphosphate kinase 2